jgi:hypothetical protein
MILSLFAVTAFIGCANNEDKGPTSSTPQTNTPKEVLERYANVFNTSRSIDHYKDTLLSTYIFYFDHNSVGSTVHGYTIPVSWSYDEDVAATTNMLSEAYKMEMTFTNLDSLETDPEGSTYNAKDVYMVFYLYPENDTFAYLAQGKCDVVFEKVNNLWCIKSWTDRTSEYSNEGCNYSYIKAVYHE